MAIRIQKDSINLKKIDSAESVTEEISSLDSALSLIPPFDMEFYRKAERLFYEEFNYLEALQLAEELYAQYSSNEAIRSLYLSILVIADSKKAASVIKSIGTEVLGAALADIDMDLADNSKEAMRLVSVKIANAIQLWPDSTMLKCRQILYLLKIASLLQDKNYYCEAQGVFASLGEGQDKLEKSWVFRAKCELGKFAGEEIEECSEAYCQEHDLYRPVVLDMNKEKARKLFEQAEKLLKTPGSENEGFDLLCQSAEANFLPAICKIGQAYNNAIFSVKEKDTETAIQFFRYGAEQGDPRCQLDLGCCYIEKNEFQEGFSWIKKAVEQELAEAELLYAFLCGKGEFTEAQNMGITISLEKDLQESMKYLKKAAEHGHGLAQFTLGMAHLTGCFTDVQEFCSKDSGAAVIWLKKAAVHRHAWQVNAMSELGGIFKNGEGVPANAAQAERWYERAAEVRSVEEAEEKDKKDQYSSVVFNWLAAACDNAFPQMQADDLYSNNAFDEAMPEDDAEFEAERQYLLGLDSDDAATAAEYFKKAANLGHVEAQNKLGGCYLQGIGVSKSSRSAAKWYQKAAEQGHAEAAFSLGSIYFNSSNENENVKSVSWLHKAADAGIADAQSLLHRIYLNGSCGVEVSWEKALYWCEKAAEQGVAHEQYLLGEYYFKGEKVRKSSTKAEKWLKLALASGEKKAQVYLDKIATARKQRASSASSRSSSVDRTSSSASSLEQVVMQYFKDLRKVPDELYVAPNIPILKENNLVKCACIPRGVKVYALIDNTVFGSAKCGVAFTSAGIYVRNDWFAKVSGNLFCSWDEFRQSERQPCHDGSYEVQLADSVSVNCAGGIDPEVFVSLLKNLRAALKNVVMSGTSESVEKPASDGGTLAQTALQYFKNLNYVPEALYVVPAIPQSKENNLVQSAGIPRGTKMYALVDNTILGSAKNGVAFTSTGIYIHNDWSAKVSGNLFCSWEEFVQFGVRPFKDGTFEAAIAGTTSINCAGGIDLAAFVKVLQGLYDTLMKAYKSGKVKLSADSAAADVRGTKVMDFFNDLQEVPSCLYIAPSIPVVKETNLIDKARIPRNSKIYALVDNTIFGSAKNGVAFTSAGIYLHNDWVANQSGAAFCSWEDFLDAGNNPRRDGSYEVLISNSIAVNCAGGIDPAVLVKILKGLQKALK